MPSLDELFGNPMYYVGLVFAFLAALSFLVFLRGFLSGVGHLFTVDHDDVYVNHARVRATWGVILLIALFIVWEVLRWLLGLFI